jgi:hypothetical protein
MGGQTATQQGSCLPGLESRLQSLNLYVSSIPVRAFRRNSLFEVQDYIIIIFISEIESQVLQRIIKFSALKSEELSCVIKIFVQLLYPLHGELSTLPEVIDLSCLISLRIYLIKQHVQKLFHSVLCVELPVRLAFSKPVGGGRMEHCIADLICLMTLILHNQGEASGLKED